MQGFRGGGGGGGGGAVSPRILLYITSICYLSLSLTTHSNFSVLNFKLGVQASYLLVQMFFFCTLATAFPTSYRMESNNTVFEMTLLFGFKYPISLQLKALESFFCMGHYAFRNSVSLTRVQLPVLDSRLLY